MNNSLRLILLQSLFLLGGAAVASMEPHGIPRSASGSFRDSGLFEGGKSTKANLEALRLADHRSQGFERWVIDFSGEKGRKLGEVAPKFQLEYVKARKFLRDDGSEATSRPARFVFTFRGIGRNFLTKSAVAKLSKKSLYVENIVIYPPIEGGDMAMEFILKDDVRFDPHQPIEREGRLVLDMKASD
jgi:hypothetical protein